MHSFIPSMTSSIITLFFVLLLFASPFACQTNDVSFDQNYKAAWGYDRFSYLNQGREVQLSLDQRSGAGFRSKLNYGSGFFQMKIKIPNKNSSGVVTAYYLTSYEDNQQSYAHDELDFEFLGSDNGPPYTLQTNVFSNDLGGREQRINLWFDPTADFHFYKVLWNQFQIVFYVDDTPIRVFKNKTYMGVNYPSHQMHIEASVWNGSWASQTQIDWTQAPFISQHQEFGIDGCEYQISNPQECYSSQLWWNWEKYVAFGPNEKAAYQHVIDKYMYYDYCSDKTRSHKQYPECSS